MKRLALILALALSGCATCPACAPVLNGYCCCSTWYDGHRLRCWNDENCRALGILPGCIAGC